MGFRGDGDGSGGRGDPVRKGKGEIWTRIGTKTGKDEDREIEVLSC